MFTNERRYIRCIYIALRTADISKCCTENQPKTSNSKQCRCRSTVAKKNSLEKLKPREEPGYEGWPVPFWRCRVEIITEQPAIAGFNCSSGRLFVLEAAHYPNPLQLAQSQLIKVIFP
jgi:hypothetical protein